MSSTPPPPEFVASTGEVGAEHPVMKREGGNIVMLVVIVPPPPPTAEARDEQPDAPPAPLARNKVATGPTPQACTPVRRRLARAALVPQTLEAGAASSSAPDTEATSAAPSGWMRGGRTGALNQAALNVQAKLRAEAEALKRCNEAFLSSRVAIRVCF